MACYKLVRRGKGICSGGYLILTLAFLTVPTIWFGLSGAKVFTWPNEDSLFMVLGIRESKK